MANSQFISGCYALSQLVSSTWFTLMKKDVVKESKNVVKQDKSINKRKRVHDTFFFILYSRKSPKNTDKTTQNYAIIDEYDFFYKHITKMD